MGALAKALKQDDPDLPDYITSIAVSTSQYEDTLRALWEDFKNNPSEANAKALIDALKEESDAAWELLALELFGVEVEDLIDAQKKMLRDSIQEHHNYLENSLYPDLITAIQENKPLENMDYRLLFLYSGALWSFGFLASITFDGLDFRDLGDLFIFAGPNDETTCTGDRGCKQYANKVFTVAQILAEDIIPGRLRCLTNCRHMLLPIASPLSSKKHLPGQHPQSTHAPKSGKTSSKIWNGEPMEWEGEKLTKLQVGEAGEQLAMKVLSELEGTEFTTLNVGVNNAPVDVGGDHQAVEVKAGLATNGKTAQHWRATIGQPGKAEQALLKQMSPKEKRDHNNYKKQQILKRKNDILKEMSEIAGAEVKPVTIGIILHPDGTKGDVYKFDGFHLRIPWNKANEMGEYLGTHEL